MTKRLFTTFFLSLCIMLLSNSANAAQLSTQEVKTKIIKHALEIGVDPAIALSIAKIESNFNPHVKSAGGAIGLFQLTPSTAEKLGINPWYVSENIKGGLMYYQMLYKKFGSTDLALAAYNAGPGNVARYNGVPPFKETRYFVQKIKNDTTKYKADPEFKKIVNKHAG